MKRRFKDRITGTGSGDQAPSSVAIQFSKYNFGMKNINKRSVTWRFFQTFLCSFDYCPCIIYFFFFF